MRVYQFRHVGNNAKERDYSGYFSDVKWYQCSFQLFWRYLASGPRLALSVRTIATSSVTLAVVARKLSVSTCHGADAVEHCSNICIPRDVGKIPDHTDE